MFYGGLGLPAVVDSTNLAQFPAAISALAPTLGTSSLGGLSGVSGLSGLTGLSGLSGLGTLGALGSLGTTGLGFPMNTFANRSVTIPFSALNIAPLGTCGVPFGI